MTFVPLHPLLPLGFFVKFQGSFLSMRLLEMPPVGTDSKNPSARKMEVPPGWTWWRPKTFWLKICYSLLWAWVPPLSPGSGLVRIRIYHWPSRYAFCGYSRHLWRGGGQKVRKWRCCGGAGWNKASLPWWRSFPGAGSRRSRSERCGCSLRQRGCQSCLWCGERIILTYLWELLRINVYTGLWICQALCKYQIWLFY